MEHISSLITLKVKVMAAKAEGTDELRSKRKAITTLLPYAVWQELSGKPQMLNTILCAARASRMLWFRWYRIRQFVIPILSKATPRAIVLLAPHIPWSLLTGRGDLVRQWTTATSMVPYTEEVARSVVDTLLQIASRSKLLPHITIGVWLWLTKRPSLPPVCSGRHFGTYLHVVQAVRRLKDIEILKSYLLLTWSEWDAVQHGAFNEICASIREDFGGVGMDRHRADLIQQLDNVLGQLDRGSEQFKQHNPDHSVFDLQTAKQEYEKLKGVLVEVGRRTPSLIMMLFYVLTLVGT